MSPKCTTHWLRIRGWDRVGAEGQGFKHPGYGAQLGAAQHCGGPGLVALRCPAGLQGSLLGQLGLRKVSEGPGSMSFFPVVASRLLHLRLSLLVQSLRLAQKACCCITHKVDTGRPNSFKKPLDDFRGDMSLLFPE